MFMEKLIKYFIEKFWNTDVFQTVISEKIKKEATSWAWKNFNLIVTTSGPYTILYDSGHGIPYVFETEEGVRKQVKEWDKVINDYKKQTEGEVSKPKRHYNKKKKEA